MHFFFHIFYLFVFSISGQRTDRVWVFVDSSVSVSGFVRDRFWFWVHDVLCSVTSALNTSVFSGKRRTSGMASLKTM